jgi:dTDP-4-dehydrorhamnose 3,5-epimerase
MKFIETKLNTVSEVVYDVFFDERWSFIKTFHNEDFYKIWLIDSFKESFYSISKKNVIRWMHFQKPPYDHDKFVYPIQWSVLDVVVDLRKNSITYWKYISLNLSKEKNNWIFIPRWFAHWFLTLTEQAILVYMDTTVINKESDSWIHWNSFWMNWTVESPIVSEKDRNLSYLKDFDTPFILK